mgnify:CR=1 FL=1
MAEATGQPAAAAPDLKTEPKPAAGAKPAEETKGAAKPAKGTTALTDPGDSAGAGPADWPDDWRGKMSAGDEKKLKRLERFKSPLDVLDFGLNAEKSWKQGKEPDPFPAEGTDEEKTAWRTGHGIPEKPDAYDLKLADGFTISDQDKPQIDEFLTAMHGKHASPEIVKTALGAYYQIQDRLAGERAAKDNSEKVAARDALRDEMGPDFQRNLTAAYTLINSAPDDVKEQLLGARLADGTSLGNHPPTLRWLISVANEINPAATITPAGGGTPMANVGARIAELQKMMGDRKGPYYTGPKVPDGSETLLQKEYRSLTEAQEKMDKRGRAA